LPIKESGKEKGVGKPQVHKMDERIRGLYIKMVQEECHAERISKKTQEEINCFLEGQKEEQSQEAFLDKILLAACAAEENGFVMGFRYAFRLFWECIQE